jgi:peptide/nickel transport system substrate-binding protein
MNKRNLIAFLGVSALLALIVLWLVSPIAFSQPKVVGEPVLKEIGKRGGQVTISISDPKSFNPIMTWSPADLLINLTHAGLLEVNPVTGRLEPALALSYEVSPDRKSIKFILRKGLRFWDGNDLKAEDIVFTYKEIILDPKNQIPGLIPLEVKASDETTIIMTVGAPLPMLPAAILSGFFFSMPVLPKHKLAEIVAKGQFAQAWSPATPLGELAGAGPFKLAKYTPATEILLERNPHYGKVDPRNQQLPYLDKVIAKIAPNRAEELARLGRGELDLLMLRAEETFDLKLPRSFKLIVDGPEYHSFDFWAFNHDVTDPDLRKVFRERLFRQAIAQALDRQRVIKEVLRDLGEPWFGTVNRLSPYYEPNTPKYDYDLKAAAEKLDRLGLRDTDRDGWRNLARGKQLEFELITNDNNPRRMAAARLIIEELKKVGVKVNFRAIPFAEFSARLTGGRFVTAIAGTTHLSDPFLNEHFYRSSGSGHFWHLSGAKEPFDYEKKIDELLNQAAFEFDFAKRKALASELQKIMSEELPIVPLWSRKAILAASESLGNVEAFTANAFGVQEFLGIIFRK